MFVQLKYHSCSEMHLMYLYPKADSILEYSVCATEISPMIMVAPFYLNHNIIPIKNNCKKLKECLTLMLLVANFAITK